MNVMRRHKFRRLVLSVLLAAAGGAHAGGISPPA